jgi:hypothetical protein
MDYLFAWTTLVFNLNRASYRRLHYQFDSFVFVCFLVVDGYEKFRSRSTWHNRCLLCWEISSWNNRCHWVYLMCCCLYGVKCFLVIRKQLTYQFRLFVISHRFYFHFNSLIRPLTVFTSIPHTLCNLNFCILKFNDLLF